METLAQEFVEVIPEESVMFSQISEVNPFETL